MLSGGSAVRGCLALMVLVKPAHEFDPGHRFGTTDCGPFERSTRGRIFFFRRPDCRGGSGGTTMEVLYSRCCGLDVHKSTITACVRIQDGGSKPGDCVRTAYTRWRKVRENWEPKKR